MTYAISGLERADFERFFTMDDLALARCGALRVTAAADHGFPCRITLEDAKRGEMLILLHHVSHDVATPYRSGYAIFVRERAADVPPFIDCLPPAFEGRPMAFRGFSTKGLLEDARLALPGEADAKIRDLLANADIAYIHAHNAAHGCYAARIDRHGDAA